MPPEAPAMYPEVTWWKATMYFFGSKGKQMALYKLLAARAMQLALIVLTWIDDVLLAIPIVQILAFLDNIVSYGFIPFAIVRICMYRYKGNKLRKAQWENKKAQYAAQRY